MVVNVNGNATYSTRVVGHGTENRGRCRWGGEVGKVVHLPVIVLGCGIESPPDMSSSALILRYAPPAQTRGSKPSTRAKQPRLISNEDVAKDGCAGRSLFGMRVFESLDGDFRHERR